MPRILDQARTCTSDSQGARTRISRAQLRPLVWQEKAAALLEGREATVKVGKTRITFRMDEPGGRIEISGRHTKFANKIVAETTPSLKK